MSFTKQPVFLSLLGSAILTFGAFTVAADPLVVNLRVDANHDGKLDEADEALEDQWAPGAGATFLNNCDDDDGDSKPDNLDDRLSEIDDRGDMLKVLLEISDSEIRDKKVKFTINEEASNRIRIYDPFGYEFAMYQGNKPGPLDIKKSVFTIDLLNPIKKEIRKSVNLLIEAKTFADKNWDGILTLSVEAYSTNGEKGTDTITARVAPFILHSGLQKGIRVYARDFPGRNELFIEQLKSSAGEASTEPYIIPADIPYAAWNIWLQDAVEVGHTAIPAHEDQEYSRDWPYDGRHGMNVAMAANRNKDLDSVAFDFMLSKDFGAITVGEYRPKYGAGGKDKEWLDWYGNLEVTPPLPGYPLGRVYFGKVFGAEPEAQLNPEIVAFIDAQEVQGPAFAMDVGYLLIKHVDEIVCFVPSGDEEHPYKVLIPDVNAMLDLLQAWADAGHGDLPILPTFQEGMTVASLLADKTRAAHNRKIQTDYIDPNTELMIEEFGLRAEDFIRIPAYYNTNGTSLVPNMVNSLLLNGHFMSPAPDGPVVDGEDQLEVALREALDGLPLTIHFLNDTQYHKWSGNVHCATNVKRVPLSTPWWEAETME